MPIPDYETLMLPLLQYANDQREHRIREIVKSLAAKFGLTEEEQKQLLPSGGTFVFHSRVGWASTYLKKAGLIESVSKGIIKITPRGLHLLNQNLEKINGEVLRQFPEFVEFQKPKREKIYDLSNQSSDTSKQIDEPTEKTPEENLESSYQTIRNNLAAEILEKVKSCSPAFFERLVVELLVKMGYGGTLLDAGRAIGRSGDGGIDGIIKEDRLGLDVIYLQAKRWEGNVSRPEVQKFAGALQGQRARKGVFITTSDFTKEARDYVAFIESKIILIGGDELAQLMIDYNVGVSNAAIYEIKKIDSDYFTEE